MTRLTTVQHDAIAIVHAGLADILAQLGEEPVTTYEPRHGEKE